MPFASCSARMYGTDEPNGSWNVGTGNETEEEKAQEPKRKQTENGLLMLPDQTMKLAKAD